ncbi:MAG: hypothetical protein RLZZ200_153 [Pseudomonadota bacterium]|jgi:endonuclease/exonuclease/phosphatase family metal-dependent hydrolase
MRGAFTVILLCLPGVAPGATPPPLRIATWNLEWLVSPATTQAARLECRVGQQSALPCDIALDAARSGPDFAQLARYARELDADVVALQEVEDAETAGRVFPGYRFCLSGRRLTQNLGFAVRNGIPFRCGPDLDELASRDRIRPGVTLVVDPGGPRELHLLTVHLKAGCARDPIDSTRPACRLLARQLPRVGAWMAEKARSGRRHVALGDFNREWDAAGPGGDVSPHGDATPAFDDPGEAAGFRSCYTGQTFTRYIDHLLVGRTGGLKVAPDGFFRLRYRPADVRRYRLSDHCPTGVVLQFTAP